MTSQIVQVICPPILFVLVVLMAKWERDDVKLRRSARKEK